MQRRQFVTTIVLAGSLSGCVNLQSNESSPGSNNTPETQENDSTETMTQEKETNVKRRFEIKNVETPSEDVPVSIGIDVLENEITPDQTGRIEVGFVFNDDIHFKTGAEAPVGLTLSSDDTPGLVLLPMQEAKKIPRVNEEMWKPDRPKDEQWTAPASAYENDESAQTLLTSELDLWADHRYDGYFEPGDYTFSNRFSVDDKRVSWNFTISVSDHE